MIEALIDLPLESLERLQSAIRGGRLQIPLERTGLLSERLTELVPYLPLLEQFTKRRALEYFVAAIVVQRRREHRRLRPKLVWTGPEPVRSRARRTSVVVQELLEKAREEVFIAGYSFQGGADLLKPLYHVMCEHQVSTRIVFDCSHWKVYQAMAEREVLDKVTEQFWEETWTYGEPLPELFYDPRTLARMPPVQGSVWFPEVSMHAKCVVVDRSEVLVGSANFTARAQSRNLEVGVLLRDTEFAEELLYQWQAVIAEGTIRKI